MKPIDVLSCPLSGMNLIEASAGTGKTWTIAALYLRLLLEPDAQGHTPGIEQILVVTYTNAATAELRTRLRARLHEMSALLSGQPSDDPFLLALAERYPAGPAREQALARLKAALVSFDLAAIFTIHGFCQRALTDSAFESGQSFSMQLITDDQPRLQQAIDDYWRRHVVNDALLAQVLAAQGATPDDWLKELAPYLGKPYLQIDCPPPAPLARYQAQLADAWLSLRSFQALEAGLACLYACQSLNGTKYSQATRQKLGVLLQSLLTESSPPLLTAEQAKQLGKLTPLALAKGCKQQGSPPTHPLFALIASWLDAWQACQAAAAGEVARLKIELIGWLADEMRRERQRERKRSFDDLLLDLYQALHDPERGDVLARELAGRYTVALIDEFQDTDPVQYQIFKRCFGQPLQPLFLVGDPKQAIYSFRGADVFAYLEARSASRAEQQFTLSTNRRSQPALVQVINTLFSRPAPFLLDEIVYHPVDAAESQQWLDIDDDRASCNWQWLALAESGKAASKGLANQAAAEACAREIAHLLQLAATGRASVCQASQRRALNGGDIAVLVNSHYQGALIVKALRARQVPSVAMARQSLYATAEARDMLQLMRAWSQPTRENELRCALATELYGYSAEALQACLQDESQWEALLEAHYADHQLWLAQGFMTAWRQFFARARVAQRLLPLPDGERRLTNLAHLAELIHKQSTERPGLLPLVDWLEAQLAEPEADDEALLRLDSDAARVKIVTVHSAKGLQYPVVFCPFLWEQKLGSRSAPTFIMTHQHGQSRVTPSLMASDEIEARAEDETLAEQLRMAYVALTRAQHRQYISWGWVQELHKSALFWLLHAEPGQARSELSCPDADELRASLQRFIAQGQPHMQLIHSQDEAVLPGRPVPPQGLQAQRLDRVVFTPWRVASFSGLIQHVGSGLERPDHDRQPVAVAADAAQDSADTALRFPRGARAGTCLHAILERIDFARPEAERVAEIVAQHGFAPEYAAPAFELVQRTLQAELAPGQRLGAIPANKRLIELEFTLPMRWLKADALAALMADPANGLHPVLQQAARSLDFRAVRGYLKGFIDLVGEVDGQLYLIDYKSNDLGPASQDYHPDRLVHSIAREHYYVQYLFYCVAIRRYFCARGVDFHTSFAGVRYLYMRGIAKHGQGIWCDQPSTTLLDALDALLAG